jgi:hypothetical protein
VPELAHRFVDRALPYLPALLTRDREEAACDLEADLDVRASGSSLKSSSWVRLITHRA